ncbi:transposable element Tc1 transposase [Trichonephila clavipes]|nr:transposable element Tc1 transposase [Trichonephila clavipes]
MADRAKLRSYRPLLHLPLTLANCRARLQWCFARSSWNHTDWGRIVFIDESRFQLCPDDHRRRVWRRPGQEDVDRVPHVARVAMNCFTAFETLPLPVRSPNLSPIEHVWDMMGRRLHLPGNVDDLAQ